MRLTSSTIQELSPTHLDTHADTHLVDNPATRARRSWLPRLPTVARVVLGSVFVVFGLNGFFNFLPQPAPPPARAMAFAGALAGSGYFFPLLKSIEVAAGALLLAGFVPLALTLLAPIIVNIVAFHLFLAPGNYAVVGLVLAAEIYLAFVNRAAFAPLFVRLRRG